MATKLFVGNLAFTTTPADLESLFGQAGAVASVNIISDKFSGQSRGLALWRWGVRRTRRRPSSGSMAMSSRAVP
jgi:hypothetical protein